MQCNRSRHFTRFFTLCKNTHFGDFSEKNVYDVHWESITNNIIAGTNDSQKGVCNCRAYVEINTCHSM